MKITASALSLQPHWCYGSGCAGRLSCRESDRRMIKQPLHLPWRRGAGNACECMWVCLVSITSALGSGWEVLRGLWLPAQREVTSPRPCSPGVLWMQRSTASTARQDWTSSFLLLGMLPTLNKKKIKILQIFPRIAVTGWTLLCLSQIPSHAQKSSSELGLSSQDGEDIMLM